MRIFFLFAFCVVEIKLVAGIFFFFCQIFLTLYERSLVFVVPLPFDVHPENGVRSKKRVEAKWKAKKNK